MGPLSNQTEVCSVLDSEEAFDNADYGNCSKDWTQTLLKLSLSM